MTHDYNYGKEKLNVQTSEWKTIKEMYFIFKSWYWRVCADGPNGLYWWQENVTPIITFLLFWTPGWLALYCIIMLLNLKHIQYNADHNRQ
jgi:hypothetical protein